MERPFISSTYRDLTEERAAVIGELAPKYELRNMENFGSKPGTPLATCLAALDDSDGCVCILGFRYGSRLPGGDISYTEAEYEHAQAIGIPIFAYIQEEFDAQVASSPEPMPAKNKLRNLRDTIQAEVTVDPQHFGDAADLATKVARDLASWESTSGTRPSFTRRAPFDIKDRAAYATEVVRRVASTLLAPPIVLVDASSAHLPNTPPAESGRLTRKFLQIEQELREEGLNVVLFTNLPAPRDDEPALEQRLSYVRAARGAVVVLFAKDHDALAVVDQFSGADVTRFVWYRDAPPSGAVDVQLTRQWISPDLSSCQLALDVENVVLHHVNTRVLTALPTTA